MTKAAEYPDFVFFLSADWDRFTMQKKIEALARRIAPSGAKVLALDRPVCLLSSTLRHSSKWLRRIQGRGALRQASDNLYIYTPYLLEHEVAALRLPGLKELNRRVTTHQIKSVAGQLGLVGSKRVAWLYHPYQIDYLGVASETLAVYECYDEIAAGPGLTNWSRRLVTSLERQLLNRVDLVFTTSQELYEAKRPFAKSIHLSRNGADTDHFGRVQDPRLQVADRMLRLRHPIIGYLGTIHEHTDIALLKRVAEARPNWTIVMIGPEQQPSFSREALVAAFRSLPNVHLLGWIDHGDIPAYCKAFDVCVIPYRTDSSFNRFVNPTKLHEYTAMGKPVVSTDLPEVHSYSGIVKVATSPGQFLQAIEESLSEDSPQLVLERLQKARKNSWDKRVEDVLGIIRQASERRLGEG